MHVVLSRKLETAVHWLARLEATPLWWPTTLTLT